MIIEKLYEYYDELMGPPGIPWPKLVADGHGIDVNGYDPAYMDYMLTAGTDFFRVIGTLSAEFIDKYKTLRSDEGRASMTTLTAVVEQAGNDVWQQIKQGNWDAVAVLPRTTTVDAMATIAASAANGAYLHYDGVMEAALRAGKITSDELVAHASSVTKIFQTFSDLDKTNHLGTLREQPPVATSGPEMPLLAGWALATLGIVLFIAVCYLITVFWVTAPAQKKALEWCQKVVDQGTKEDTMACASAAQSMQQHANADMMDFFKSAVTPIVAVLAVGAAFYMAPFIIGQVRKIRAA